MNLPNRLTLARIGLTGVFVAAMLLPREGAVMAHFPYGKTLALAVFVLAALTDWLDGWLARRDKLVTNFGALLDPVADKVLTTAAFICFIEQQNYKGQALVQGWMVLIIVARDFLVTGLRLVAGTKQLVLHAEQLGKHKTISQMTTIIIVLVGLAARDDWALWGTNFDINFSRLVFGMMLVTVVLTVWSGFGYFWRNREIFNDG
ncbi:MAG: CDP-diacylglycerol--glycerol-3-phosphate 3-phosphatidyltransferase [Verrucomicrobiae bacterium]|nr:CDP-diacylglycerol--glycerol-3-phosphate 3-phosphatidyltransferase [Verrucomicrobiae bacterium]